MTLILGISPEKIYVSCEELGFFIIVRPDGPCNVEHKQHR